MRKVLTSLFSIAIAAVLLIPIQTMASEGSQFDEFGLKENVREQVLKNSGWEEFSEKSNVPTDKEWTVDFSSIATYDKIDAIVIERNKQFIPVQITFNNTEQVKVKGTDAFAGNATYTLKILLANGKKYKMDFITATSSNDTSDESISTPGTAFELGLNETVKGDIATSESVDFYKVEIPSVGTLDVNLTGFSEKGLAIELLRKDATKRIDDIYTTTFGTMTRGLAPGTYYIKVFNREYQNTSTYELGIKFTESAYGDIEGATNMTEAPKIELSDSATRHIGYIDDQGLANKENFFKIEVPQEGILDVRLKSHNGTKLELYLYGKDGDDRTSIDNARAITNSGISTGLTPGTYYAKVILPPALNQTYTSYDLDLGFTGMLGGVDMDMNRFEKAELIELNHHYSKYIGFFNDDTTQNRESYYKVEVPANGTLNVGLSGYDDRYFNIALYDGPMNSQEIASDRSIKDGTISAKATPGTYYVKVSTAMNYRDYSNYLVNVNFQKD